jgi:glutamate synthase (NADPH/NADH) large chain
VVVLGPVGHNVGAGMTGGSAFVWDPGNVLLPRLNTALVEAERPLPEDLEELRWLVERHAELTGSERATALLKDWDRAAESIWHVVPLDRVRRIEQSSGSRVTAAL